MPVLITAILLGIVEGLTEFLPVSSTGHLILASELLGYKAEQWAVFNIVIQLGAILAVIVLYWRTFFAVLIGLLHREPTSWRFLRNLVVAVLPAAVIGFAMHKQIEALLGNALVVAVALIVGGIAILIIEAVIKRPSIEPGVAAMPLSRAVSIGFMQCLAMVPGVSRSGATIMGALSLGIERRTAAEFSFFLAVPTMLGATLLELVKNRHQLLSSGTSIGLIAVGFVVAFLVALVVIRWFVGIISKRGFGPFAWYRIVAGTIALIWLLNK